MLFVPKLKFIKVIFFFFNDKRNLKLVFNNVHWINLSHVQNITYIFINVKLKMKNIVNTY